MRWWAEPSRYGKRSRANTRWGGAAAPRASSPPPSAEPLLPDRLSLADPSPINNSSLSPPWLALAVAQGGVEGTDGKEMRRSRHGEQGYWPLLHGTPSVTMPARRGGAVGQLTAARRSITAHAAALDSSIYRCSFFAQACGRAGERRGMPTCHPYQG
jgi:hypothetical protein